MESHHGDSLICISMNNLVYITRINKRWNRISPNYWSEVILPHKSPDNVKAKIINRSCSSLKSIHFVFYFDYLLAFKSLQSCVKLKHLTIGEGGLNWIAGANASTANQVQNKKTYRNNGNLTTYNYQINNTNNMNVNNNGNADTENEKGEIADKGEIKEDVDAKLLVLKATSAANMAADASNEANNASNSSSQHSHSAHLQFQQASSLLSSLPPSPLSSLLLSALNEVNLAIEKARETSAFAMNAANAAASAANAASVAAGLADHVFRYHSFSPSLSSSFPSSSSASLASSSSSQHPETKVSSTSSSGENGFRASQIKTLRVTSGRSYKKIIPDYKHLYIFSSLTSLSLDGSISAPHLEGVILSARNLQNLSINCSDSGNELLCLRHASSLTSLVLYYFSHLFVSSICTVPSLSSLHLQYTTQSPQIGLQQLSSSLPRLQSFRLHHPSFTIISPSTANESELGYLRNLKELSELDVRLPCCDPELFAALSLSSLKKLGTSMILPVSFVQRQQNLHSIIVYSNHLSVDYNPSLSPLPPNLPSLLPNLRSLSLVGIPLSQSLACVLSRMRLKRLRIKCEELKREEIEEILKSETLEELDLCVDFLEDVKEIKRENSNIVVGFVPITYDDF